MQREESIDAQLRACRDYAKRNNLIIVGEYIDRGKSATTANRPEFQRMIEDSNTKAFDMVLVHKLDRFARNRNDSILYRVHLKRNDIELIKLGYSINNEDYAGEEGKELDVQKLYKGYEKTLFEKIIVEPDEENNE